MNRVFTLLVVMMLAVSAMSAQKLFLGPSILFKGGVNAGEIAEGQKTAMNINAMPDISANMLWMFNKDSNLGLIADIGYTSLSFRMRPEEESIVTDYNTVIYKPSYITIAPQFYMSGFTIGVGFSLPAGMNVSTVSGTTISTSTDNLNSPVVDIRLGGMIPVWEMRSGRLSILIHASYTLTGLMKTADGEDNTYNPKVASGGLGLAYHFNLTNIME